MKSTAHINSHPLHPILVSFPIAFYTGTLVFDLLFMGTGIGSYDATATYLNIAAIVGALAAAVPGIIDYRKTVPPDSSAKQRAATHGMINAAALLVFCVAIYLRLKVKVPAYVFPGLDLLAMAATLIAGWMGGTLVYRNQIGVDIRYADAGKWKEVYLDTDQGKIEVALSKELKVNQMKLVHLKDKRIVLAKTEAGYAAFNDRCTHKGASLAGGSMICSTVQCPWHGSQFDVNNGQLKAGPAKEALKTYTVVEEAGRVFISL